MITINRALKQARQLVLLLADWIFPKECVGCGYEGRWLCLNCQERLSWQLQQTCLVCGGETHGKICRVHDWTLDRLMAATDYKCSLVKDLIKVCKYRFSVEAADELSQLLWQFWQKNNWRVSTGWLILPVPLSRRRLKWRGFNQAAILAKNLAQNLALAYNDKNLVKTINTHPQVSLSAQERLHNLQNCFAWRGQPLTDKKILLIDDVVTTGATLNECAKVLKQAGAIKVWGIVVAK